MLGKCMYIFDKNRTVTSVICNIGDSTSNLYLHIIQNDKWTVDTRDSLVCWKRHESLHMYIHYRIKENVHVLTYRNYPS